MTSKPAEARRRMRVEVTFRSPTNGGRTTIPVGDGYPPHACVGPGSEYLGVRFLGIPPNAVFDRPFEAEMEPLYPGRVDYTPLLEGRAFMFMEGSRRVGTGRVLPEKD